MGPTPRFSGRATTNQAFKLTDESHCDSGPLQRLLSCPFNGPLNVHLSTLQTQRQLWVRPGKTLGVFNLKRRKITPAFSCGARSAFMLKEQGYLRSMLSRRQLQGFVGLHGKEATHL
jgi:hypothetical protein